MNDRQQDAASRAASRVASTVIRLDGLVTLEGIRGSGVEEVLAATLAHDRAIEVPAGLVAEIRPAGVLGVVALDATVAPPTMSRRAAEWLKGCRSLIVIGYDVEVTADVQTTRIDTSELHLTGDEIASLGADRFDLTLDRASVDDIATESGGWRAYAVLILEMLAEQQERLDGESLRRHPTFDALVAESLSLATPHQLAALGQLAHLERFDSAMLIQLVGQPGLAELKTNGFPLRDVEPGWMQVCEPVRHHLLAEHQLSPETASEVLPTLERRLGIVRACEALVRAGQYGVAARRLRALPSQRLTSLDQRATTALLKTLISRVPDDGSLRTRLARVQWSRGHTGEQRATLEEAERLAAAAGREDIRIEAAAERLFGELPVLDDAEAQLRLEPLLREQGILTGEAQLRLQEIEGIVRTQSSRVVDVTRSVEVLQDVARQWELRQFRSTASNVLTTVCGTALEHLGWYADGIDAARSAVSLADDVPTRAKSSAVLCRMLALAGQIERFDEERVRAERFGQEAGLDWIGAHLAWSRMIACGLDGSPVGTVDAHLLAAQSLGALLTSTPGTVFLAESAVALSQVGELDRAEQLLDEALLRSSEARLETAIARLVVLCRRGRGDLAAAWYREITGTMEIPVGRLWRLRLELLAAGQSDIEDAGRVGLREIEAAASDLRLGPLLGRVAAQLGLGAPGPGISIRALGPLCVTSGRSELPMPGGHVARLIRMLAVSQGPVHTETIVDRLWPDTTTDVGRRRLKNVMSRCRQLLGESAIPRRDDLVWLDDAIEVDVRDFRVAADSVDVEDASSAAAARRCIALYRADPIPEEQLSEWAQESTEDLRMALVRVVIVAIELRAITPHEAVEACQRTTIYDEGVYVRIARYALEWSDFATARRAIMLARRTCVELDVSEPQELQLLDAALHRADGLADEEGAVG